MNFEVVIPGEAEGLVMKLALEAPNWLDAIQQGLYEVGGELALDQANVDIQPDGTIHVTHRADGRVYIVRPLDTPTSPRMGTDRRAPMTTTTPGMRKVSWDEEKGAMKSETSLRAITEPPFSVLDDSSEQPGLKDDDIVTMVAQALPALERDFNSAEKLIDAATDLVYNTVSVETVLFMLPVAGPREYRVVADRGSESTRFVGHTMAVSDAVAESVVGRGSALVLNRVAWSLPLTSRKDETTELSVKSIIWAPIMHRGRLLATVAVLNSKRADGFSDGEHGVLDLLCMTLAKLLTRYL